MCYDPDKALPFRDDALACSAKFAQAIPKGFFTFSVGSADATLIG